MTRQWSDGQQQIPAVFGDLSAGLPEARVLTFSTSDEASARISALVEEGDLILVKGSRGIKTERVVDRLKDDFKEN
jgi:UDP-N-acetylmuramoyl-tripeptide--D-alanyl-D-alanine ligase